MRKIAVLLIFTFLVNCKDDVEPVGNSNGDGITTPYEITQISFKADLNATLFEDIVLNFDGVEFFTGVLPYGVDIKNLIPSIVTSPENGFIKLDEINYQNNTSSYNFSKEVNVDIFNSDQTDYWRYKIRLTYFTGLPIISIDTDNIPVDSRDFYVSGELDLFGGLIFDDIDMTSILIRGRGNTTWFYPKRPYQIKFDTKTSILGLPEDRKWVLLAEYSDKSLMRNKIAYEMGAISSLDYTPKGEYVEVFLNNNHLGTYLFAQKVEESSNRVNIGDEGYLIEIDQDYRVDPDDVFFTPTIFTQEYSSNVFNIKAPNISYDTPEFTLIEDHINNFEAVLFGSDFTNPDIGYRSYIDINSFVDWFLINEIAKTVDARWYSSIYFTYIPGGKIKMGPIWDFDLSFGNVNYADSQYTEGYWIKYNPWFSRMFEDPYFENLVIERFDFYYQNLDNFNSKIDEFSSYLSVSQSYNYDIWQTLGTYVWPNPVWFDTHQEEVDYVKQWLLARMNWLNQEFGF
jgi:hypothetical protein